MPTFHIKCADQGHPLYWYVDDRKCVQLTDKRSEASEFQGHIHKDDKSFYISTATDQPAIIYSKAAKRPHKICRERKLVAKSAYTSEKKFRFELRGRQFTRNEEPASKLVGDWKNGGSFFVKPADVSFDMAVAIILSKSHTPKSFNGKLKPMSKHDEIGKQGSHYYMLWSCEKID